MPSSTDILAMQGLQAPNPFRADSKAVERFERVRARLTERHRKAAELEVAVARAAAKLSEGLPAGLGDWGVVRTRAWRQASENLRRAHARMAPSADELNAAVDRLNSIPTMTLDQCAALTG